MAVEASEHKLHVLPSLIHLSVVFLCMLPGINLAQSCTITGKVIDSKTLSPLPSASVYLNNTTIGTTTNLEGDFTLEKLPLGEYEFIVSYVGYRSHHSKILITPFTTINMTVNLLPMPVNLNAVDVSSQKDNEWNIRLEQFKKLFFGNSPYTSSCKIFNPWVLDFEESKNGVLIAKAHAPLEIENPGLGYHITYQLTTFIAGNESYNIKGYVRFRETETVDTALIKLWSKRRAEVYLESYRHLFKSMVDDQVEQQGFQLFEDISGIESIVRRASFNSNVDESIRSFNDSAIVVLDSTTQRFRIKLPPRLEVHYTRKNVPFTVYKSIPHPISWIEVKGGYLEASHNGIVLNPSNMIVSGVMGESRVAEILPYDYVPPSSSHSDYQIQHPVYKKLSAIANLVEQPYLHTDRPYYYPNELVHYKVYMNYVSPVYSDSLSHVIHVELIHSSGKVLNTQTLPIVDRTASGNLLLPSDIAPGDYFLRAYTRWMLNFDHHYIFNKPLKILASNQLVKTSPYDSLGDEASRMVINANCDEYITREQITLTVETKDFFGFPIASNLSVTVTDLQQVSPVQNERNILSDFAIKEKYLPDSSFKKTQYAIQYGIDFCGQLVNRRNKPKKGALTIFQETVNDVFAIITDHQGIFKHQLQFYDSLELHVQVNTESRQKGKVILDSYDISPPLQPVELLKMSVYTISDSSQYHLSDQFTRANMLGEVTVAATKITTDTEEVGLLQSDFRIDGEWLRASVSQDLLSAIQSKVPGLRVLSFLSYGTIKKYLVFTSSMYSNGSLDECLVEVDGVVLNSAGDQSVADQLASMSVSEIESIEVVKYAGGAGYGARGSNGVIIVKTVKGIHDNSKRKPIDRRKVQTVKLYGFTTPIKFNFPEYSTASSGDDRIDIRSTIYWNPNVTTNGKEPAIISFYTADIPTEYRIVIEGIDSNGEPVRGEKVIHITSD